MENINNKIIVFSQNTAPIILDILQRFNLKETNDEFQRKITEGKIINSGLLLETAESIVLGEIRKENLVEYLKNNLNLAKDVSEKLAGEIDSKLVSLARIASQEDLEILKKLEEKEKLEQGVENENEEPKMKPLDLPIEVEKIINNAEKKPEKIVLPKNTEPEIKTQENNFLKPAGQPQKNDSYREPID
ncbi:MAG: hypothetical protein AAB352_00515 [Patescibacteria group bacterium]